MFGLEDEQAEEILRLKKEILRLESELEGEAQRKATLEPLLANLKYEWGEWKRTIENAVHEPDNLVKAIDDVIEHLSS